jgi:small GTP-binding protein
MEVEEKKEEKVKIIFVGNTGVGKTCIIRRFVLESFDSESKSSDTASQYDKTIKIEGKSITCQMWDTAGQEQYRSISSMYYKGSNIACLVYDITNKESFKDLKENWIPDLKENGDKDLILAIVGNKNDFYEKEEVSEEDAREFAEKEKCSFFLVSAKNGDNINFLFQELAKEYLHKFFNMTFQSDEDVQSKDTFKIKKSKNEKKKKCCK